MLEVERAGGAEHVPTDSAYHGTHHICLFCRWHSVPITFTKCARGFKFHCVRSLLHFGSIIMLALLSALVLLRCNGFGPIPCAKLTQTCMPEDSSSCSDEVGFSFKGPGAQASRASSSGTVVKRRRRAHPLTDHATGRLTVVGVFADGGVASTYEGLLSKRRKSPLQAWVTQSRVASYN